MAVLVLVSGLILDQINTNRRLMARNLHQQEVLSVATMAVQTKQDQLTLNGITVTVKRSQQGIAVYESERRLFMSLNSKVRAFTLLECLVALLVIAGSVQVYQGLTTVLVSNVTGQATRKPRLASICSTNGGRIRRLSVGKGRGEQTLCQAG